MKKEGSAHKELIIALIVVFALGIGIGIFTSKTSFNDGNSVTARLVAVDDAGNGVSADIITKVKKGTGSVFVSINNAVADHDTQISARKAAQVAAELTGIDLNSFDVSYDIKTSASRISGASAGTPMTIATIAALQNKSLNQEVGITGVIGDGGVISLVGSIPEKAAAAKSIGMHTLLVPSGSDMKTIEHKRTRTCGEFEDKEYCEISYRDKASVGNVLEIKEISNIKEAIPYFIK